MAKTSEQVIEPYQLRYSDLLSLSSSSSSSSSPPHEIRRLKSVTRAVMEALGPTGPGLLTITGVPNVAEHRSYLLPLARDLSLLHHQHRKRILKNHGLGSDVSLKNVDRCVSSFAMQLKYEHDLDSSELNCVSYDCVNKNNSVEDNINVAQYKKSMDDHFKDLGFSFRELGVCMMDLGLRVARICDKAIGGNELENSLLESGTAKGRLIHYHSSLDTCIIKESGSRKGLKRGLQKSESKIIQFKDEKRPCKSGKMYRDGDDGRVCDKSCDLWQQWHYDYGTFTVLTSPMFLIPRSCEGERAEEVSAYSAGLECLSPSGNTYLQIFHPEKNNVCTIKAPPESFILQVGESADILSRKKLQATLHSVSRPVELDNLSRETFVVFLHPAWNKVFDSSNYPTEQSTLNNHSEKEGEKPQSDEELNTLSQIHKLIPPLSARLKDGMTFAEFSRETTKQYYGGNGLQSNR